MSELIKNLAGQVESCLDANQDGIALGLSEDYILLLTRMRCHQKFATFVGTVVKCLMETTKARS